VNDTWRINVKYLYMIKDFAFAVISGIFNSPLQGSGLVQTFDCCEEVQYRSNGWAGRE
jgi:hypothetical protein